MSFVFPSWSTAFSPAFYDDAKVMLETALNKGNKPPVIQGRIEVVDLNMGTQPPTLTLLEIGDLSVDRFRGILRLGYQGDAWIEVRCRVQANPLSHNPNLSGSSTLPISTPLLANQPLLVPMTLRLSKLHLRAILILVVSASKGITLVFKNDPLQNVDVSSTFDSVDVIRGYLQQEIEGQLREMFREDLPGIIHRLSQRWFSGAATVEPGAGAYRDGDAPAPPPPTPNYDDSEREERDEFGELAPSPHEPFAQPLSASMSSASNAGASTSHSTPRRRGVHRIPGSRERDRDRERPSPSVGLSESPTSYTVFPDIENYDPTYGLRPEGLPTHSGYEAFGRLWEKARRGGAGRGLGSLMDVAGGSSGDEEDDEDDGGVSDDDSLDLDLGLGHPSPSLPQMERTHSATGTARTSHTLRTGTSYADRSRSRGHMRTPSRTPSRTSPSHSAAPSSASLAGSAAIAWESFPAVGGGVVTRPRVFHAQSQIRAPSESGFGPMPSPAGTAGTATGSVTARASSVGASSTVGSLRAPPNSATGHMGYPHPPPVTLRRTLTTHSDMAHARPKSLGLRPGSPLAAGRRTGSPSRHRGSWDGGRPRVSEPSSPTHPPRLSRERATSYPVPPAQPVARRPARPTHSHSNPLSPHSAHSAPLSAATTSALPTTSGFLRPGRITIPLNNSVSQLATLSLSANTLSPYARAHEHIAVRSFPYLGRASPATPVATPAGEVKATRKRIFRLGKNGKKAGQGGEGGKEVPLRPLGPASSDPGEMGDTPPLEYDDAATSSDSRWRLQTRPASVRTGTGSRGSYGSYGFPKIPE